MNQRTLKNAWWLFRGFFILKLKIMNELIKITETENGLVSSARELHKVLEIKTEFSKWCERMFKYGFTENKDYTLVVVKKDDNLKGGRNTLIDYALTIDTAKEISMIQRSEIGKKVREYYLECEKVVKKIIVPSYQIENPIERAKKWIEEQEEKTLLIEENKKLQFRSDFVDVCFETDGLFSMEETCKILKLCYGRNTMMQKLRDLGILLSSNTPKQSLIKNGSFKVVETMVENKSFKKLVSTTYATQKGIALIHKSLINSKL